MRSRLLVVAVATSALACAPGHSSIRPALFPGQTPDLRAQIEPNPIRVGETATYTIRQPGTEEGSPESPDFGGLVASGPEIRTGIVAEQSGAGLTPAVLYVWSVVAPHSGSFTIGRGHIFLHGRQLTSNKVQVSWTRELPKTQPPPSSPRPTIAPTLTASVSPPTVQVGQEATFLLQIQNPVEGQLRLPNFGVLTANRSSTVGATRFAWRVTASDPGRYTIGAASLTTASGSFRSEPITVIVTEPAAADHQ